MIQVIVEIRVRNIFTDQWSEWHHWHTFKARSEESAERTRTIYANGASDHDHREFRVVQPTTERKDGNMK